MGVVTIASDARSLIRGQTMTEGGLGLVLLQRGSFFDNRISNTRSAVFVSQPSVLQFLWITPSSTWPEIKATIRWILVSHPHPHEKFILQIFAITPLFPSAHAQNVATPSFGRGLGSGLGRVQLFYTQRALVGVSCTV